MDLHERFKQVVSQSGKNQKELAELCDVTHQYFSQAINGRHVPSLKVLTPLAKETGVNLHWLLTGEGEMYFGKPNANPSNNGGNEMERLKNELLNLYRFIAEKGIQIPPYITGVQNIPPAV